ncbi:hypothetical protein [Granulicella tundricola]|uniref:hypothetical protein n=1 Tax=Granulicella tundricola TaxID=940615 RepID=UPI00059FB64A|nr:hypothetical protein [Granulicella tundricola]
MKFRSGHLSLKIGFTQCQQVNAMSSQSLNSLLRLHDLLKDLSQSAFFTLFRYLSQAQQGGE